MRQILIITIVLTLFVVVSCTKESIVIPNQDIVQSGDIKVVDGYLDFQTTKAFEDYLSGFMERESGDEVTKSTSVAKFKGFTSLAERKNIVLTKSGGSDEMTFEEYQIMMAEKLLVDPVLSNVMDTTLMIGVDGKIFKVTGYGTFSISSNEAEQLPLIIEQFDQSLVNTLAKGETINLGGSATFTNTFGEGYSLSDFIQLEDDSEEVATKVLSTTPFKNNFHSTYGTVNYSWANSSVIKEFFDLIRGKKVTRTVDFDSKHRVEVQLYDVNYLFYATTGIKCEMQTQKKFLFVNYWVADTADDMVIGFNKLCGELNMKNPRYYLNLSYTNSRNWSSFSSKIDKISTNFIYGNTPLDIIKDWANDMTVFLPRFDYKGSTCVNFLTGNELYKLRSDKVFTWLKAQSGKYSTNLSTGARKQIQTKDPRVAYFVNGNNNLTYNKERHFIMGVKSYGKSTSQLVRIDTSFGFTLNLNLSGGKPSLSGFLPTEFSIEEVDAFGAAKYGGKWRGVRFIFE